MKKSFWMGFCVSVFLTTLSGCKILSPSGDVSPSFEKQFFEEQFKETTPEAVMAERFGNWVKRDSDDAEVFKRSWWNYIADGRVLNLTGVDDAIITSENIPEYKATEIGECVLGTFSGEPVVLCDGEGMRLGKTYTLTFFPRGAGHAIDSKLTPVATPPGGVTYAEASLVIECRVIREVFAKPVDFIGELNVGGWALNPEDLIGEHNIEGGYFPDEYKKRWDYHQRTLSEITHVWKKQ